MAVPCQYERYRQEEQARIEASGQEVSNNVIFVKQTISNACGTIALIHSVCNNVNRIPLGATPPRTISRGSDGNG